MKLAALLKQPPGFNPPALAEPAQLRAAIGRVLARWPDIVADPPENDREKLVQEMLRRLDEDDWSDLPTAFVTKAARALFDPLRRSRSDLARLRQFYVEELSVSTRRSFLGGMASVYVGSYEPGAPHTRALASALQAARSRLGGRWVTLEEELPEWLDPVYAPEIIAARMTKMAHPWGELKAMGFSAPHAPGLMDHAHLEFVRLTRPVLSHRSGQERLFGWLRPEGQEARASGAAEAISAILGHWLARDPSSEDQRYIIENLVGCYGDPRVSASGAWAGVPEQHRAVILRWLTGENIRFFLDVVSAVEESHMWEPRRKFWLSLHEEGRIDGAWVAFSAEAANYARHQARARSGQSTLRYGLQTAGGSRVNTSLLVLKIGNRIVVEGSHSYKIHIFRANSHHAPSLYQARYDCEQIRLSAGVDARSHIGDWQGWVRERI
ncbi:EH signature domain-containing protein [Phreatobacter oligotrophus]|uniref:EH signature protein n=1 Tax=Phreatobacter oligotrophus TaxID=1122261 RepID=A0A2T4ZDX9_9HYPH|nr:EH signature domain-containing protein [Phreatobacter oligotrophus]PTM60090.1 EH signature protein [Phreatobacter oligotrophus]